jgi:hypothetical protein
MQQQKNKAMEDRKLAILEAKYEAQVKKQRMQQRKWLSKRRERLS